MRLTAALIILASSALHPSQQHAQNIASPSLSNTHGQQQKTRVRANSDEQSGRQGRSDHHLEQDADMAVDAQIVSRVRRATDE